MVMLQMAEKTTKTKRRALLMTQNEPKSTPGPISSSFHEPQPLPGDAFERMRMDPEIQQFRQRLIFGAGMVAFIVLVMVVWSLWPSSGQPEKSLASKPANAGGAPVLTNGKTAPTTAAPAKPVEEPRPQVNSGNLVFRPPGSRELKTATALPSTPAGDLAKLAAAEEILSEFLQSPNWKQRVDLVRDRTRVAQLMSIYYAKNADGPIAFDSIVEATEISPKLSQHVVVFEGGAYCHRRTNSLRSAGGLGVIRGGR